MSQKFNVMTMASYSMLALALIGIADAIYVAHGNYTGQRLWCPIIEGCNAVVNSPYSRVCSAYRCPILGSFTICICLDWQRGLFSIRCRVACGCVLCSTPA